MRGRKGVSVVVAVATILLGAAVARAQGKAGMVDIVEVMNGYERTKDAGADLQMEQNKLKGDSEAKVKRLDDVRLQRDGFKKGTEEWKKLDDQALQLEMEIRTWVTVEQAKLERKHMDVMLDMFRQIQAVVGRVAKEKALDLVYTRSFLDPPQIDVAEATGLDDLKARIVGQRVLYPVEFTDITKDVLKILNDDYAAAKKKAGDEKAPKG